MHNKLGPWALVVLGLGSCQTSFEQAPGQAPLAQFKLPLIQQPPQPPPAPLQVDSIRAVAHRLVGRFSFANRLNLQKPDSLGADRYELDSGQPFRWADSLNTDGLELIADYQTSLPFRESGELPARLVYPVYIVNSTPRAKLLCGKDSWTYAIQEARDRTGQWRPIESKGPESCGNGEWILKIRPRQMVVLLVDKYQGSFKTRLRLRLSNGNSQYVSAAYEGWISETQFLPTQRERRLLAKDKLAVAGLYYGALPALIDSLDLRERQTPHN